MLFAHIKVLFFGLKSKVTNEVLLRLNIITTLKGTHFQFLIDIIASGVVPCGGPKKSPRKSSIVQIVFTFGPLRSVMVTT